MLVGSIFAYIGNKNNKHRNIYDKQIKPLYEENMKAEAVIMLEVYSNNIAVEANTPIDLNNISLQKGCTATLSGVSTINLNKCGVYCVSVNASAEASTTIQLNKNGVEMAQAQATGENPSFMTLVQVSENNSPCMCSSPTQLQILSSEAVTFSNINCVVTKLC